MIRTKISDFIKRNKDKIRDLGSKLVMVAMIVFIATIILSSTSKDENNQIEEQNNVYQPTQTIISGSNISEEKYEEDSNLVNTFLEFCNNGKVQEAYELLTEECKEESYPTIERFKENYYNYIFNQKRVCNLQAYISNSNYTIYKVRYTNDMLATGTYDENNVYQDYITLNKKNDEEKISIGNFVDSEDLNCITQTDVIQATVTKKKIYMQYEEYEINIKNNIEDTILLDNLDSSKTIKLVTTAGNEYRADINKLLLSNLIMEPNEIITITLRFNKTASSNSNSEKIEFLNVIRNYYRYMESKEGYTDTTNVTIKVVD